MLAPNYRPVVGEKLPSVRYRVGLQAVKDEDRRILDYSELITTLDEGAGHKFMEMVSRYVGSNVENTANEVDRQYGEGLRGGPRSCTGCGQAGGPVRPGRNGGQAFGTPESRATRNSRPPEGERRDLRPS